MKKYLLGTVALVLAISFSAFTKIDSAKKKTTLHEFYFFQGSPTSQTDVQNKDNWKLIDNVGSCSSNSLQKACRIDLDLADATDNGTYVQPSSSVTISAHRYPATGTIQGFYVETVSGTTVTAELHNRTIL